MSPQTTGDFDALEATYLEEYQPSEFIGDPLDETNGANVTRIYIQNVNGLSWDKDGGKWPYIIDAMNAIQADISCFSELNVDTNKYQIRKTMEAICQKQF